MVSDLIDLVLNKSTLLVLLLIGLLLSVYAGKLVYDRETDAIQLSFKRDFSDKVKALRRELFVVVKVVSTGGTRNRVSLQFQKISEKNKRDIVMFLQEKQIEKARRKKGN